MIVAERTRRYPGPTGLLATTGMLAAVSDEVSPSLGRPSCLTAVLVGYGAPIVRPEFVPPWPRVCRRAT